MTKAAPLRRKFTPEKLVPEKISAAVGKGAGGHPTGSAVLSDISALRYGYQYEYRKMGKRRISHTQDELLTIYLRYQTPQDLAGIYFEEVNIEYKAKDFNYLIGRVRLSNLYALRDSFPKRNIFIARIAL